MNGRKWRLLTASILPVWGLSMMASPVVGSASEASSDTLLQIAQLDTDATDRPTAPVDAEPGAETSQSDEPSPPPQAEAEPTQIEEIVVTAQKRLQVSQDVPISMSVISERFIRDRGITDIADALQFVPNFKIKEFGNFVTPQCRGFSIDEANPAFEPPCGIALDGIAISRGTYFVAGLFDVKRMEVLRGPQGTTFGKNTTAGVVSVYSKDPTDDFVANADLQYGVDGPLQRRAEAGVGGPLIPGVVNFRVAGVRELREGYAENTYHQVDPSVREDAGARDRSAYRLKLTFPNVFGSQIKLLHERSDLTSYGLPIKVYADEGSASARFERFYDPNFDFGENNRVSNRGGQNRTVITRNQAEWSKDFGGWDITLVGATGELNADSITVGSTAAPTLNATRDEDSPFSTIELRAVSPTFDGLFGLDVGANSSVLMGLFGQRQEIKKLNRDTDLTYVGLFGVPFLSAVDAGAFAPFGLPPGSITSRETLEAALASFGSVLGLPAGSTGESFYSDFGQQTDTLAAFSQFTWNVSEKWTIDLGSRVSIETKTARWDLDFSPPPSVLDPEGNKGFEAERTIGDTSFQPKISLGYELTDNINLFSHWAKAFKSGGFNAFLVQGNPETATSRGLARNGSLSYDDEIATEWGLDAKMQLLDNRMQLNISLFRLDVDDFQVLTNVPGTPAPTPADPNARLQNGYQEVANAGKARAQGVEADLLYLPTAWLTVIGSVGYNDTEFLSFKNDNCEPPVETPDPESGKCDHSGKPFKNIPEWSNTLGLDARIPLGPVWSALGDLELLLGSTAEYTGSSVLLYNPEPGETGKTDATYRYRAHIGVSAPGQGWSFRVTGLNLSDEDYVAKSGENGVLTGQVPVPRSVFAQFSWTY